MARRGTAEPAPSTVVLQISAALAAPPPRRGAGRRGTSSTLPPPLSCPLMTVVGCNVGLLSIGFVAFLLYTSFIVNVLVPRFQGGGASGMQAWHRIAAISPGHPGSTDPPSPAPSHGATPAPPPSHSDGRALSDEGVEALSKLGLVLERLRAVAATMRSRPQYQNVTSTHIFRTAVPEAYWLSAPLVNRFLSAFHPATPEASRRFTIATFGGSVSAGHDNPSYLDAYPEQLAADLRTVLTDEHFEHRNRAIGNSDTVQTLPCMPGRAGLGESRVDVVVWEFAMNDAGARTGDHHAWHQIVARSGAVPMEVPFSTSGKDLECKMRPADGGEGDALPANETANAHGVYASSTAAPFALEPVFGSMGWFTCDMKRGIQTHGSVYCGADALQMPRLRASWHPNERGHRLMADQLMFYYSSAIAGAAVSLRRMIVALDSVTLPPPVVHGAIRDDWLPPAVLAGCRTRPCRSSRIPRCFDMWKPSYDNLESLMDNSTGGTWHTRQSGKVGLEHRPPAMHYQKLCLGGNHSAGPLTLRLPRSAGSSSLIAATPLNDCSKGEASGVPCGSATLAPHATNGTTFSILVDGQPASLVDDDGHNKTAKCQSCVSRLGHAADCRDLYDREGGRWWGCSMVPLILHEGPFADVEAEHTITIQVNAEAGDKEFCLRNIFWMYD